MAVGRLCQRSVFGRATKPRRRASARTAGVSATANRNDTAGGTSFEVVKENIAGDYTELADKLFD